MQLSELFTRSMSAKALFSIFFLSLLTQAGATVSIISSVGELFDSGGVNTISDNTLWALVIDGDNDGDVLNTAQDVGISTSTANSLFSINQSIDIGTTLGGDVVFAIGGMNGAAPGIDDRTIASITLGGTIVAGRAYAFVWFPGATWSGTPGDYTLTSSPHNIASQVGSISASTGDGVFDGGMFIPSEGTTVSAGALNSNGGGTVANSHLTAVNLVIPEPSTMLLGVLGGLLLLRRSRTD